MSSNQNHNANEENEQEEKPGTSASFYGGGLQSREMHGSSEEEQSLLEGNSSSVKARNTSRERPISDAIQSKRLKISDEEEDDVVEGDDYGMAMDTDSSEEEDVEQKSEAENMDEVEAVKDVSEPDSFPQRPLQGDLETSTVHSRRNSATDENVSTTMQSSSLRYADDVLSSRARRDSALDQAIASTSAAAMAPPLSRIMEEVPSMSSVYRHTNDYAPEDMARIRRSDIQPSPPISGPAGDVNIQQRDVDVNENHGPDEFLQKMHGKQRLMWARKLFFASTELVFPGFTAYSDNRNKLADYLGVRVRSSCVMQALLYADALFFVMWILSFLSTCDILITVLKQLHGYLSLCLTCLFIIVNAIRLRFGLKGNENDEVQYLALFWMITVIVQIPLFTFILLTDLFCPVLMAFTITMDGAMMIFILLESIVGFIHFRSLLRDELNIVKMAKRSKEARASTTNISNATTHQRKEDTPGISASSSALPAFDPRNVSAPPNQSDSSNSDSENENGPGALQPESMDFRMQIRRLSQARREVNNENEDDSASDSSGQVTSTSDTIRHRPIRAH